MHKNIWNDGNMRWLSFIRSNNERAGKGARAREEVGSKEARELKNAGKDTSTHYWEYPWGSINLVNKSLQEV